jgi:hypothetical protein
MHKSIIDMEIFDLEGNVMEERHVSEALRLLWNECLLDDIEESFRAK